MDDENREEFVQVLDEVSVEDTASYQPKVINTNVICIVTNPTQIEDSTEPGSLCDDCEVDYEVNTKYAGIFKSCMGTSINDVPRFLAIFELPTYLVLLYNIQFRWLSWTPAYLSIRRQ